MSRKRWGKSKVKTDKTIREAVPKKETEKEIDKYLDNARSVTVYDLSNRFNIRLSVAKKMLRKKEQEGVLIPYIKESGFVVYTTVSELEKHESGKPIMLSDVLEEVASSVPEQTVFTEEVETALAAAASSVGAVKPSKLTRKRREAGERKERKDTRPEIVVEPLEEEEEPKKEKAPKKEEKKPPKKKPKKKPKKEKAPKKEEKKPPKKKAEEKEEKKPAKKKKKAEPKKKPKPKITDIPGIGPKTAEALAEAKITTVYRLSKSKPETVAKKVDGISEDGAEKFIGLAKEMLE